MNECRVIWQYFQCSNPEIHTQLCLQEGFYLLLEKLVESGVISELLIIIEGGYNEIIPVKDKINIQIIPAMDDLDALLRFNDIIFCRNGFRSWFKFLNRMNEQKHWVLFYRAASNRYFWQMWDCVLDDIDPRSVNGPYIDEHDRMYLPVVKPAHPRIFYPEDNTIQDYDFCIGASHIHTKKGQMRSVKALIEAQKILDMKFKCVLPGRPVKRSILEEILDVAQKGNLNVDITGMIDRVSLAKIYNRSKAYIHLATCGQNDRGPLEAMACGTPAMIGFPIYHPPYMIAQDSQVRVASDANNPVITGTEIADWYKGIEALGSGYRTTMRLYYLTKNGLREVALPIFEKLFTFLRDNPVADRQKLWSFYGATRLS